MHWVGQKVHSDVFQMMLQKNSNALFGQHILFQQLNLKNNQKEKNGKMLMWNFLGGK